MLSKSAENGFGAASRSVLACGRVSKLPQLSNYYLMLVKLRLWWRSLLGWMKKLVTSKERAACSRESHVSKIARRGTPPVVIVAILAAARKIQTLVQVWKQLWKWR
jgi:hypothetical protein